MNTDDYTERYAHVYDVYVDTGAIPITEPLPPDPFVTYICSFVDKAGAACKEDPVLREMYKELLMDFCRSLYPPEQWQENQRNVELSMLQDFQEADLGKKRMMWKRIEAFIRKEYTKDDIDIDGYVSLLREKSKPADVVLDAFAEEWREALARKAVRQREKLINDGAHIVEENLKHAMVDYPRRVELHYMQYDYPELRDIVRLLGRQQKEMDSVEQQTTFRYLPEWVAPSIVADDVEGICLGRSIPQTLPSELAFLSNHETEDVFYYRYARAELQQTDSKPPVQKPVIEPHTVANLGLEPIILVLDTSESMAGKPEQIAKSLLLQAVSLARKQHRACFVITFSIQANSFDAASYADQDELQEFLSTQFFGGTDGTIMLQEVLHTLRHDNYRMADVLIISDFDWYPISACLTEEIRKQKDSGTHFYGLNINRSRWSEPFAWLDRVWNIKVVD